MAHVSFFPVHVLYAVEVSDGNGGTRLLEQSAGRPFTFPSRESAEALIKAGLGEGACAVELTLSARFPEP
jgi:hypothetical protein